MNDETLIGRIAEGDAAATTEFYNRWFPQFTQLATKLTCNSHAGEDLAQEVVVRVLTKAGSYKPEWPARAWLLAILYNRVRDWGRRERFAGPPASARSQTTTTTACGRRIFRPVSQARSNARSTRTRCRHAKSG